MTVVIRHMEDSDLASIATLFAGQSVIDGTMRLPLASLDDTRRRLAPSPGAIRLVAIDDAVPADSPTAVLGVAELLTYPDLARHRHAGELELLAVRESAHGQGIGRRLLGEVVDLADQWLQLTRLALIVWTDNLHAIALYESAGFRIEGTMPAYGWRKGTFTDAHVMGRVLPVAR